MPPRKSKAADGSPGSRRGVSPVLVTGRGQPIGYRNGVLTVVLGGAAEKNLVLICRMCRRGRGKTRPFCFFSLRISRNLRDTSQFALAATFCLVTMAGLNETTNGFLYWAELVRPIEISRWDYGWLIGGV